MKRPYWSKESGEGAGESSTVEHKESENETEATSGALLKRQRSE
jgi:hypothetical protein